MSERENILGRIREALQHPTHPHLPTAPACGTPAPGTARQWLPSVGTDFVEQLALFRTNAEMLKAEFVPVAGVEELNAKLQALRTAEGWQRVAAHAGPLARPAAEALGLPVLLTDQGYAAPDMEQCPVGISECDALVAQTGSVLVTSRSAGGRALSCLPPHHIVVARTSQLVADLPAAFELLQRKYSAGYPSMISFITGPSRTGDIERILVLGAHGPKRLTIFCLPD